MLGVASLLVEQQQKLNFLYCQSICHRLKRSTDRRYHFFLPVAILFLTRVHGPSVDPRESYYTSVLRLPDFRYRPGPMPQLHWAPTRYPTGHCVGDYVLRLPDMIILISMHAGSRRSTTPWYNVATMQGVHIVRLPGTVRAGVDLFPPALV